MTHVFVPAAPLPQCATCTHWERLEYNEGETLPYGPERDATGAMAEPHGTEPVPWGVCQGISLLRDRDMPDDQPRLAFTQDASEYEANLYTRDVFGCVLHESKETT